MSEEQPAATKRCFHTGGGFAVSVPIAPPVEPAKGEEPPVKSDTDEDDDVDQGDCDGCVKRG